MESHSHSDNRGERSTRDGLKPPSHIGTSPYMLSKYREYLPQNARHEREKAGGCEPPVEPGTSKGLCLSTAAAHPLLCPPEADRKEGAQLLAPYPSMSQLAELAGQEAWRNKLLSSRLQ